MILPQSFFSEHYTALSIIEFLENEGYHFNCTLYSSLSKISMLRTKAIIPSFVTTGQRAKQLLLSPNNMSVWTERAVLCKGMRDEYCGPVPCHHPYRLPLTHSFRNTKQKFDVPYQKPTYVITWNLDNRDEWLRHLVWTRMQPMRRLSCVKTKRQVALRRNTCHLISDSQLQELALQYYRFTMLFSCS